MKYAPIIIPTLCRDTHFIRLIESLKRNSWAKYTDVFIGLDYPPSEKYREGYNNICQYLKGNFSDFKSFNVIRRTENYGSSRNLKELRDLVLLNYDRFIRTDDDAEFSPNFLEYMNKCLDEYEDDEDIIAVTGYSYPIKWNVSANANVLKENFSCPMWGTGFWRKKYNEIKRYILSDELIEKQNFIIRCRIQNMMQRAQWEYMNMCMSLDYKRSLASKLSDISVRMYMSVENKYVIVPVISKVRNWGFDGTGEYCQKIQNGCNEKVTSHNYPYSEQMIDANQNFNIVKDVNNDTSKNRKLMNNFDTLPLMYILKTRLKILLYKILGRYMYNRLVVK